MPKVNDGLNRISAIALSDTVLLDLNRIALQAAYAKRFQRIPDFFPKLLSLYSRGFLPCGWNGSLTLWPEGQLIVYQSFVCEMFLNHASALFGSDFFHFYFCS